MIWKCINWMVLGLGCRFQCIDGPRAVSVHAPALAWLLTNTVCPTAEETPPRRANDKQQSLLASASSNILCHVQSICNIYRQIAVPAGSISRAVAVCTVQFDLYRSRDQPLDFLSICYNLGSFSVPGPRNYRNCTGLSPYCLCACYCAAPWGRCIELKA